MKLYRKLLKHQKLLQNDKMMSEVRMDEKHMD